MSFVIWMVAGSLFLTTYSTAIPPIRHFLEAQFESEDFTEALVQIQDSIQVLQTEIDEIKQLVQELDLPNNEDTK